MNSNKQNSSLSVIDLDRDENDVADNGYNTFVHNYEVDLKVGMVANDENGAFNLYNSYALSKGFSVRRSKKLYKGRTDIVRGRRYVCNREGKSDSDNSSEEKKVYRLETRTGCLAHVIFSIEGDLWVISKLNDDHNHDMVPQEQHHLLKSGRKIEETSKTIIKSMTSAGIKPIKVYNYLAREAGGFENVGFTKRDTQNFLQKERENLIGPSDAQSLVNHFKSCLVDDPLFFHHELLDEHGRMLNVFWTDGTSRVDYDCFGDVVVFDTTYRTNKYNMICAPFVGVNHHWKNIFFGCAFLQNETTSSFVRLFQTFLEAMGNKSPKTIFTDQDQAMANAIQQVFPEARHRLCTWHISKNATQHISHLYANSKFKEKFNYLLKLCEVEAEFESTWTYMMEEWNLKENKWLKKLYGLREKWSVAFSRDTFSGNIRSTQRSESTNNVFQQQSGKTMSLCEFVKQYEDCVSNMRHVQIEDDFNCSRGKPHLFVRGSGLLKHASEVYTLKIFKLFQDEFLQCILFCVVSTSSVGGLVVYKVRHQQGSTEYLVHFDPSTLMIECSCQKFESMGLLCRHALFVLNSTGNGMRIPEQYVLKRWTRDAKKGVMVDCKGSTGRGCPKASNILRLSKLMRRSFQVMNSSSDTNEKAANALKYLDLIEYENSRKHGDFSGEVDKTPLRSHEETDMQCSTEQVQILDPTRTWPKGVSYGRQKSSLEKRKRKASTQSDISKKKNQSNVISDFDPYANIGVPAERMWGINGTTPYQGSPNPVNCNMINASKEYQEKY